MMCMTRRPPELAVSIGSDRLRKLTPRAPSSGDERNQMREGSPKPVQFPHNEGVARAESSKGCIETAAREYAAAYTLIREHTPAPSRRKCVALQGEVLVNGRTRA